jgi:hypothetical protein
MTMTVSYLRSILIFKNQKRILFLSKYFNSISWSLWRELFIGSVTKYEKQFTCTTFMRLCQQKLAWIMFYIFFNLANVNLLKNLQLVTQAFYETKQFRNKSHKIKTKHLNFIQWQKFSRKKLSHFVNSR